MLSVASSFNIALSGKGGHGAYPHMSVDCVLAAADIITQLYTVLPRAISCFEAAVITVGKVHTGSAHNVIPDSAALEGTIRTFQPKDLQRITEEIASIASKTAAIHDCLATTSFTLGCPPVINDHRCAQALRTAMIAAFGSQSVLQYDPIQASDDFSYFLQEKPGAYAIIGTGKMNFPHSSEFRVDEEMIEVGVQLWMSLIKARLGVLLLEQSFEVCLGLE
jgi:amidohydrolase